VNPDLASTLESLCEDSGRDLYQGLLAVRIADDMRAGGGLVTGADLAAYRVVERTPLTGDYRGNRLLGNPPPARGGALLALALDLLRAALPVPTPWGSAAHVTALASVMCEVERRRGGAGGTTHISVVDAEGNVASMSLSNGEGSGYVVPGTGIMLNNMLGEDDLHPGGFHASPAGVRVESMMAPTVLLDDGLPRLVLGSGGSKRIRTALLQVISNVVDFGMTPERAVRAPRLHFDGERLQAEPGYAPEALAALGRHYDVNVWEAPNLYFGGVHAAVPGQGACGDPRRGGAAASIGQPALGSGGGV
jgi:gamma-glutamyltranspeptidase/glutathione hydrolase